MSIKSCATCVFCSTPKGDDSYGKCNYPIPEWLVPESSGGFIDKPFEHWARDCEVYLENATDRKESEDGVL